MTSHSRDRWAGPPLRAWPMLATVVGLVACAAEAASRQLLRGSLLHDLGGVTPPWYAPVLAASAIVTGFAAWSWRRRLLTTDTLVALALGVALVVGLAVQPRVGARLQSDGFFYFAFLRSIVNDHDVDLANDYALLGVSRDALLAPTSTGYAQTAWSIGPAIAWLPFYALGDASARYLGTHGAGVALDGASYPYRQAVCIAGLFYGLLGFWFCYRFAARHASATIAALATAALGLGSFMTWYLVREPTMSHATSMCAVAGFLYFVDRTAGRRTAWQWAVAGLLGGFMLAVRWQNLIFLAFPAWELARDLGGAPDLKSRRTLAARAALFGPCALVAFSPQLWAWHAIYGSPIAVSPLSPEMRWTHPALVNLLWSSRNGLFSTSPVTYLAALGLVVAAVKRRAPGWLGLAVFALAVYVNASVGDWWGGSAYGARRFDGTIPLLVLGLVAAIELLRALAQVRPLLPIGVLLGALVLWNVTAFSAALAGGFGGSMPRSFEDVWVVQTRTAYRWFGHPFSYPANLAYALRYGVPPASWDLFAFPFLDDPSRPYGRIDVGGADEAYLGDGWHAPERDGDGTTFRWSAGRATLLVPLDHPAPLLVQLRVRPFSEPGTDALVRVGVNGLALASVPLASDWQRIELPTRAEAWHGGLNRVELEFPAAAVPATVGLNKDTRQLGAMVDYLRVQVAEGGER